MIKKNITIAFVTPLMVIGGAETYIINKCEWLITKGINVIVISEGGENVVNLPKGTLHINFKGISLPPLVFKNKEYHIFKQNLKEILISHNVDIIEAHNSYPIVHVASIYKETKIPFYLNVLSELSYRRNPLLKIITNKLNKFNLFYLLTPEMQIYIEGVTYLKFNPIIIPIPVKAIPVNEANYGEKYILSVSRLSIDKDYVRHLIKDFYELYKINDKFKDSKLIIVGDGNLFEELNEIACNINKEVCKEIIQFKGIVLGKDLEILYQNCTMFVGMGTTLLLAASCAKPSVIAGFTSETNKYAWGFWGENDSDASIIAIGTLKDRNPISFHNAIESIIESDIRGRDAGNAAFKMFNENYDYNYTMTLWFNEYQRIMNVFEVNGKLIAQKLKYYELWIHFYRQIRRIVKFARI